MNRIVNRRAIFLSLLPVLCLLAAMANVAHAFEQRMYGGLSGGSSWLKPDTTNSSYELHDKASQAGSVYLGWDYSPRWSLEAYYAGLGTASLGEVPALGTGSGSVDYSVLGVSAIAYFYSLSGAEGLISRRGFSLFGGAGVGYLETESSIPVNQVEEIHFQLTTGIEYGRPGGLAARLQLDGYDKDAVSARLGILYRFGGRRSAGIRSVSTSQPIEPPAQVQPPPVPVLVEQPVQPVPQPQLAAAVASDNTLADYGPAYRDSDNDGIADARDVCGGTVPGSPVNNTGCPLFEGRVEGVTFESGSAALGSYGRNVLDEAAARLLLHPDIRISVQAHTDNQGSADGNLQLSKQRALMVTRYLISRGVARDRLQAQAFGESRPVASNDSERGRQLNRRIEFRGQ